MSLQWIIAIGTGGLALVALFQHHIKSWLTTPSLCISTKSASPYCKKLLFNHSESPSITANGYAIRIAVKNITPRFGIKSRIEEAEVFLAELDRKEQDGKYHPVQGFEPANLLWSHTFPPFPTFPAFTSIAPNMERFCFVGRLLRPSDRHDFPDFDKPSLDKDKTCLRLDVSTSRHTKEHIIPPGKYRLKCVIGGANVKGIIKNFGISISGEWFDDELEMYEKGLSIEMRPEKV